MRIYSEHNHRATSCQRGGWGDRYDHSVVSDPPVKQAFDISETETSHVRARPQNLPRIESMPCELGHPRCSTILKDTLNMPSPRLMLNGTCKETEPSSEHWTASMCGQARRQILSAQAASRIHKWNFDVLVDACHNTKWSGNKWILAIKPLLRMDQFQFWNSIARVAAVLWLAIPRELLQWLLIDDQYSRLEQVRNYSSCNLAARKACECFIINACERHPWKLMQSSVCRLFFEAWTKNGYKICSRDGIITQQRFPAEICQEGHGSWA